MVNLLLNPGFETGITGSPDSWWTYTNAGTVVYTYPETGRVGGSSVAVNSADIANSGSWAQNVSIIPGKTYTLSGYLATQNIVSGEAYIAIDWNDNNDNYISTTDMAEIGPGTTSWTYYTGSVTSPSNATTGNISLGLWLASGKAWFDDIVFDDGIDIVCNIPTCNLIVT
jgi:hypothetical protein